MSDIILPRSIQELFEMSCRYNTAGYFSGGTDLFVRLRAGQPVPDILFGLEHIPDLKKITVNSDCIRIGATVTHQMLLDNPSIRDNLPALYQAVSVLGSPPIRHMGTIGGNICTASPAGDTLPALYVYHASLVLLSPTGERTVRIEDFIQGPGKTILQNQEILREIVIPMPDPDIHGCYIKVGQRNALAIAIVSMAMMLSYNNDRRITLIRAAFGSVGPKVMHFPDIDSSFDGEILTQELLRAAGFKYSQNIQPISDLRASAEYRHQLVEGLPVQIIQGEFRA